MTFVQFSIGAGVTIFLLMIPAIYRIIVGPTALDRIVAVNVIGTKTAVILVIIGIIYGKVEMFVDFALAYALLNFTGSIAAARFLHGFNDRIEVERHQRAQVDNFSVDARFFRRRQRDMHHRAIRQHRNRGTGAADQRLAERHDIMPVRHFAQFVL